MSVIEGKAHLPVAAQSFNLFAMTAHRQRSARGKPGGHIVKDKFSIGDYGNIALVSDPDGNVVGFHSMA
jgi:predicted enzyme related to lactoylglutathione lyase